MQARGAPVPPIKVIPILLFAGETTDEEDDALVRCVYRTRRLSSMCALRSSANVADVRLERKLRYDYAKLKARGQFRNRMRNASATKVAASAGQTVTTTHQPTPLVVGNGLGLEMTLATMFKPFSAYGQSCRRGISYSHEFFDSRYPRHFTRYWYWP